MALLTAILHTAGGGKERGIAVTYGSPTSVTSSRMWWEWTLIREDMRGHEMAVDEL